MQVSRLGRIGGTGDGPAIGAGIVSPACIHIAAAVISAPDDHLTAGPHCRVIVSAIGRIGRAGGCPAISAGIVPPASVQIASANATPYNHFTAGPDCHVTAARLGHIGGAGGCPGVIGARINLWKSVRSFVQIRGINGVPCRGSRVGRE